jgi:hypothetical protein
MQNWHDWAAYCAGSKELRIPTPQWKSITLEGMGEKEVLRLQSPYAPSIIDLEIPVITRLGLKDLPLIGA